MAGELLLNLRRRVLERDARGYCHWREVLTPMTVRADQSAILLCDVWDRHWSQGATERVNGLAPRVNQFVGAARARGVHVIHAPSETVDFYAGTPARQCMRDAPYCAPPVPVEHPDPPLPIDDSDGGSDTGEREPTTAWSRQHPTIEIDQDRDGISDDGQEIYNFIQQRGIRHLLIAGVHTNMCILHRPFGIKQMVRWGVDVVLVRDLTDALYNPARPPYVSHDEGTRLVVEYIEKFWCPSVLSGDLV